MLGTQPEVPAAKWGLLREGWAVPLLEGWLTFLLTQTLGYLPRARMCESYVDPGRSMVRRHGLLARDWREAIRGARRPRRRRCWLRPFRSPTGAMPWQTVALPQLGLADGNVAAKGAVLSVKGVADNETEPKLG